VSQIAAELECKPQRVIASALNIISKQQYFGAIFAFSDAHPGPKRFRLTSTSAGPITAGLRAAPRIASSQRPNNLKPATVPVQKVEVRLSGVVLRLLEQASARRQSMTPAELAAQILSGCILRGSIDRALAAYGEYLAGRRAKDGKRYDAQAEMAAEAVGV